jgi:hypothetical protein
MPDDLADMRHGFDPVRPTVCDERAQRIYELEAEVEQLGIEAAKIGPLLAEVERLRAAQREAVAVLLAVDVEANGPKVEVDQPRIRELADEAVYACLPVLPLNGSADSGYRVSDRIDPTVMALPEEWATAAHAIAELHRALNEEG